MKRNDTLVGVPGVARYFKRSSSQVRRWIHEGCPVERPGRCAKGQGALLDLRKVEQWYATRHQLPNVQARAIEENLAWLARLLWDTLKRASGPSGQPIHETLGLPIGQIAAFLFLMFTYAFRCACGREPWDSELPEPVGRLGEIARAHAHDDRVRLDR